MVNKTIEKKGDGLLGLVLGTKNIKAFRERVSGFGFPLSASAEGEGRVSKMREENGCINFCHQK